MLAVILLSQGPKVVRKLSMLIIDVKKTYHMFRIALSFLASVDYRSELCLLRYFQKAKESSASAAFICTLSVTSCLAERSFSGLKRVKSTLVHQRGLND